MSRSASVGTPGPAPTSDDATHDAPAGKVLFVSRSMPPGVSGSAHVMKALLQADTGGILRAVGERSWAGRRGEAPAGVRLLDSEVRLFGRGARFLQPVRRLLRPGVSRTLREMADAPDVDRVVCVFPDAFYCAAALDALAGHRKPLDFWFHNTYADNRRGLAGWIARRAERRVVESAARLFFINEALRDRFADKYPEAAGRCLVLRHPVPGAGASAVSPRGFAGTPIRALLMGNLNESNMDAACRMMRALASRDDLAISVCTPVPRALLVARGMSFGKADYLGYVDDAEMARLLAATDLFLLPHGLSGGYSPEEYRTIFPTRAAHYLAAGRPILAHCPAGSGLERYLARSDTAEIVTAADEAAITAAFERLRDDPARQLRLADNAQAAATEFDPARILATLIGTNQR